MDIRKIKKRRKVPVNTLTEANGKRVKKPTILHLITNVNIGGAELTLLRTIKFFNREKFNHIILTLLPNGSLWEQFRQQGVKIQSLNMRKHYDIFLLLKYIRILRNEKPEIVVVYLFHALTFAVIGKLLYPKSILVHYKRSITLGSWARDALNKLYTFFVDYLISISKGVAFSESKSKFHVGSNSFVVYNGIKLPLRTVQKKRKSNDTIIIGTIARLKRGKGLTYLVEAAKDLKKKDVGVKFVLIGDGDQYTVLQKKVEDMKLSNFFELKGEKRNIGPYLEMFDIFILPSQYEGFGNVIIEAMSYMIPVIGTNVSGINEIIKDNENGLLIEPRDPDRIVEAVLKLIENPLLARRLGREGRKTVERCFTIQRTVARLEAVFSQIVFRHRNLKFKDGVWTRSK